MSKVDELSRAEHIASNWRLIAVVIAFGLTMIGGALLMAHFRLGMAGAVLLVVIAIGFTAFIMRGVARRLAESGCGSAAMMRYNRRMMLSSIGYMVALLGAVYLHKQQLVSGPLLWGIALVPAAFVLAMVWAMTMLIVEERDEYLRYRVIKQALFATSGLLALATIWGFLEQFNLVGHVPAWAAVPVFAVLAGLGQCFRGLRS